MRYDKALRSVCACVAIAAVVACGGGGEKAATKVDSAAGATPAPPPAPVSFSLVAKDGSWSADISPASIVFRKTKGAKKDSMVFDYKAPNVDGAITEFRVAKTVPDTHTFGALLSMVPCSDNTKKDYTHMAQVWVDQVAYSGCAVKK